MAVAYAAQSSTSSQGSLTPDPGPPAGCPKTCVGCPYIVVHPWNGGTVRGISLRLSGFTGICTMFNRCWFLKYDQLNTNLCKWDWKSLTEEEEYLYWTLNRVAINLTCAGSFWRLVFVQNQGGFGQNFIEWHADSAGDPDCPLGKTWTLYQQQGPYGTPIPNLSLVPCPVYQSSTSSSSSSSSSSSASESSSSSSSSSDSPSSSSSSSSSAAPPPASSSSSSSSSESSSSSSSWANTCNSCDPPVPDIMTAVLSGWNGYCGRVDGVFQLTYVTGCQWTGGGLTLWWYGQDNFGWLMTACANPYELCAGPLTPCDPRAVYDFGTGHIVTVSY